jgi:hypothetical protein
MIWVLFLMTFIIDLGYIVWRNCLFWINFSDNATIFFHGLS